MSYYSNQTQQRTLLCDALITEQQEKKRTQANHSQIVWHTQMPTAQKGLESQRKTVKRGCLAQATKNASETENTQCWE